MSCYSSLPSGLKLSGYVATFCKHRCTVSSSSRHHLGRCTSCWHCLLYHWGLCGRKLQASLHIHSCHIVLVKVGWMLSVNFYRLQYVSCAYAKKACAIAYRATHCTAYASLAVHSVPPHTLGCLQISCRHHS